MLEIVTLFLGLVSGPQQVELAVRIEVAEIEVLLDGEAVATLSSPPWRLEVDLGEALMPHELLAVARDGEGRELARARRWINIDPPRVEIGGEPPAGGLTPLPVVFPAGRTPSPAEVGGGFLVDGRLLAVSAVAAGAAEVVVVQDPATQRRLEEMARLYLSYKLSRLGHPAEPLPRDAPRWNPKLLHLAGEEFRRAAAEVFRVPAGPAESRQLGLLWQAYRDLAGLGPDTEVRFISPLSAPVSRSERQRNLFMQSAAVPEAGLFWLADKLPPMSFALRFADAVAIAGREAHAGGRRRAVLLLLDGEPREDSLFAAAAARDYLRALRVPLHVWTLSPTGPLDGWGEARFVGFRTSGRERTIRVGALGEGFDRLGEAAAELRRELAAQRVVWLGGEHLPHRVELGSGAAGARPAGVEPDSGPGGSGGRRKGPAAGGR